MKPSSRPLRILRYSLWAVVALLVAVIAIFAFDRQQADRITSSAIGGPFTLVDQTGATVTEAALKGHPSAMFFGYTFCPDVCPTTLYEATQWLKALGPDGDRLKVYFVTVDPERDTREQMAAYLGAFDPRIVGLTGTRPQIDAMLKEFRVYSKKVGDGPDYAMDHTAAVYLLDANGQMVGTADYQEKQETVMAKLKRLLGGA
ncbi:SCO family protein [Kaistia dalseonensis]|uniref:Protein SCO1/2 n=1 Tax=Kaistia dalseonensis TaxID=410840 RepID=A0ABU0HCM2_9HYPH|nr:SCO family protein [Kaistia dalseonensis]MCX5497417.1 SCO family protein [Kaistia dalseonensis]MDQ0440056.1 protein SCO1/2 [Kaistia dalseonensis]